MHELCTKSIKDMDTAMPCEAWHLNRLTLMDRSLLHKAKTCSEALLLQTIILSALTD